MLQLYNYIIYTDLAIVVCVCVCFVDDFGEPKIITSIDIIACRDIVCVYANYIAIITS